MSKRPEKELVGLTKALGGRGRHSGHSPLYWFMREHFEELQAAKAQGRADWKSAVEEFSRLGITNRDGKPPAVETAKKTWARVVKDMGKPEGARPAKPDVPVMPKPPSVASSSPDLAASPNPFGFRPGKPRGT